MKNIFYILVCVFLLGSCSEYQKVLKNPDIKGKFDMANKLYAEGVQEEKKSKLLKSIKLYEQIEPSLQGKPQAQIVQFNLANAFYSAEDYIKSSYKFERFTKAYPNSQKLEESFFKSAESFYYESSNYSLDQKNTDRAISKLQNYINEFPDGEYFDQANIYLKELRFKIEKKYYEIAKQYHYTYMYKAAISDFDNYLINYPLCVVFRYSTSIKPFFYVFIATCILQCLILLRIVFFVVVYALLISEIVLFLFSNISSCMLFITVALLSLMLFR